ncbi:hypothetical protein F383_23375 [Gossypium arboreum]|uniref:Uncharacterized protein n=1 Tax=Gossypium arboreum TaxID=29729 RepID=A0A0B0P1M1_GOSAR|nr:hypothetical protein F383_23375 [Gossypium arboreum]
MHQPYYNSQCKTMSGTWHRNRDEYQLLSSKLKDPLKSEILITLSATIPGIVRFIFLKVACIGLD